MRELGDWRRVLCVPLVVNFGRDFRGLDFRTAAPEDVGVGNGDADGFEVAVDGGFVLEDAGFFGAVDDAHDVDVAELWPALAPVAVGHAKMTADFRAGLDFSAFRDCPVEEPVEAGDALAGGGRLDVFEKGGEAADDFFRVKRLGDFAEAVERDAGDFRALVPRVFGNFIECELLFEREQHGPFFGGEIDGGGGHHDRLLVGFVAGFEGFAAGVADAEGEDTVGRHQQVFGGSG